MKPLRWFLAVSLAIALAAPFVALRPGGAAAHPLGNFTINQFVRIDLYREVIRLHYVVDMAEIPTYQLMSELDVDSDGTVTEAETQAYVERVAVDLIAGLRFEGPGGALALTSLANSGALVDGQAGLKTLRLALDLESPPLAASSAAFAFANQNFEDRLGWREVIVVPGDGVSFFGADAPSVSVSDELRTYPDNMLSSPLDTRAAAFEYDAGTGVAAPALSAAQGPATIQAPSGPGGQAFADLVSVDDLSVPVIVLSLFVAFALGAVHALSPGHGKTIVAAYFVGSGGTPRQAVFLAATVTAAHTVGVLALGAVTLYLSEYILPEDLYPILTLVSGLILVGFGATLLFGRVRRSRRSVGRPVPALAHSHGHAPGPQHDHGSMTALEHARAHLAGHTAAEGMPWRSLVALGISGGILPSPTALIVLLGALSLHRFEFGLVLILSFSLGLAVVLTSVGLAFVVAQRFMAKLPVGTRLGNAAPTAAAIGITLFGLVLATRAVVAV